MKDNCDIINDFLQASGTTLNTLVGSRIWWNMDPSGDNENPAIVFHAEVETSHVSGAVHTCIFAFKCYGGSQSFKSARTVYRALWDRLHKTAGGSVAAGQLLSAHFITASPLPLEPSGYAAYLARFEITTKEE